MSSIFKALVSSQPGGVHINSVISPKLISFHQCNTGFGTVSLVQSVTSRKRRSGMAFASFLSWGLCVRIRLGCCSCLNAGSFVRAVTTHLEQCLGSPLFEKTAGLPTTSATLLGSVRKSVARGRMSLLCVCFVRDSGVHANGRGFTITGGAECTCGKAAALSINFPCANFITPSYCSGVFCCSSSWL